MEQEYPIGLIDAHVHIYDCFDIRNFLDAATRNFQQAASTLSTGSRHIGVLLLTETVNDNKFSSLIQNTMGVMEGGFTGGWRFIRTEEDCSILAINKNNQAVALVAGRQIISREKLEILAVGTAMSFPEHLPINDVLAMVRKSQALAVLPWGFGKWLAQRGAIIENILESSHHPDLFLGDNGGRPGFLPRPRFFAKADKRDIRILPGSDPLPLSREMVKPGSFGFILNRDISITTPASDIKRALSEPDIAINAYGKTERPLRFARNQVAMQLAKYKG